MREVAPHAALSLVFNALDAAFNGILLAKQDYAFLLGAILPNVLILQFYTTLIANKGIEYLLFPIPPPPPPPPPTHPRL